MIFVFVLIFSTVTARNNGSQCCSRTHGRCREICEHYQQFFRDADSKILDQFRRLELESACPDHKSLRRCITHEDGPEHHVIHTQGWKHCCEHANAVTCENACLKVSNPGDVIRYCRRSDEMDLLNCIENNEAKESCCAHATEPDCHHVCTQYARGVSGYAGNLEIVNDSCSNAVVKCIQKREIPASPRKMTPYIPCCYKTANSKCREACKKHIRHGDLTTMTSIIENLRPHCGDIFTNHHELWNCFANSPKSKGVDMQMDLAKLECCSKSVSETCRQKCKAMVHEKVADSTKIRAFEQQCFTLEENNMMQCLDEVEQPCEQGCQDLAYCSNFNHKHGEMFRTCKAETDSAARNDAILWKQTGFINFENIQMKLPIYKDESRCPTSMWKSIACTLAIRPCEIGTQSTKICRSDCEQVLSACINDARSSKAYELCDKLAAPAGDDRCVSFNFYNEAGDAVAANEVTHPCSAFQCPKKSQICVVDSGCVASESCGTPKGRKCLQGCRLGQRSSIMVPVDTEVIVPVPDQKPSRSSCHRICKCNRGGLGDCLPPKCGVENDHCTFGNDRYEHGSSFFNQCNLCSCYEGQTICTDHSCGNQSSEIIQSVIDMTAHCNCTDDSPVCDRNGVTYRSPCVAKCFGVNEFQPGSCESINHCSPDKCSAEKCIVLRQVCLGNITCPQHICISPRNCDQHSGKEVCSIENETRFLCEMASQEDTSISYFGPCLTGCSNEGVVCGSDGNTYESECLAFSRMVTVDYPGPCMPFTENEEGARVCDESVECSPTAQPNCSGLIPPGACCPICAGAFQILYSKRKVTKLYETTMSEKPFTVEAILKSLSREVKVPECAIRGYLTNANYIIVMVVSVVPKPTPFQLKACVTEAEKLTVLIQRFSPRITSILSTSIFATASKFHYPLDNSSCFLGEKIFGSMLLRYQLIPLIMLVKNLFLMSSET